MVMEERNNGIVEEWKDGIYYDRIELETGIFSYPDL
jgi:hypothetical protein